MPCFWDSGNGARGSSSGALNVSLRFKRSFVGTVPPQDDRAGADEKAVALKGWHNKTPGVLPGVLFGCGSGTRTRLSP